MRTKLQVITPLMLLAVAACSRVPNSAPAEEQTAAADAVALPEMRVAESEAAGDIAAPPAIGHNVAPGVAFNYAYTFGLPAANISKAQEEHAALCERLGIVHCRVTGMTYEKQSDGTLNASTSFKLDPAMAGSFGRDATDMIEKSDGSLTDSRINGTDVGSQIVESDKTTTQLNEELAKIEAQLKIPNLSKDVRSRLVERQTDVREQLRALSRERDGKVESLATTPVLFDYAPNEAILGFDNRSPVQQAFKASGQSFTTMMSFIILTIGVIAPWALLGGAIFWLVRRLRPSRPGAAE